MKQDVEKLDFWKDRITSAREEFHSVYLTNPAAWEKIASIHRHIVNDLCGNAKVLDAGCGYGRLSEWVGNYTGVDLSPDFIKIAQTKYPDKKFVVGNLRSLPFKDGEFDWAICISIRNMLRDYADDGAWEAVEKELKRVARKVLILEYTEPERYSVL